MHKFVILCVFLESCYANFAEYERLDPKRDGFKTLVDIGPPTCQTHDYDGNVLLNGRVNTRSVFEVHSTPEKEGKLSIVFCVQDTMSNCHENGLTLCFPSPPDVLFVQPNNQNDKVKRVLHVCENMNGVIVSTEPTLEGTVFRIDTVYGNTYRFPIPRHNCFILWLIYGEPISLQHVSSNVVTDFLINPVTVSNDISNLNYTKNALKYSPNWDDMAVGLDGKPVTMTRDEVTAWPILKGEYLQIPFVAKGSDHCCAITARITGQHLSKCYLKWVQVGEECRARQPQHETECMFAYTVGKRNVSKVQRLDSTVDWQNLDTQNRTYRQKGWKNDRFIDQESALRIANETLRDIGMNVSRQYLKNILIKASAMITLTAKIDVSQFKLSLEAYLKGGYYSNNRDVNDRMGWTEVKTHFNNSFSKHLREARERNRMEDEQESLRLALGSTNTHVATSEFLSITSEKRTEPHYVRSIVRWPNAIRAAQLFAICHGSEWGLNVNEFFGNDPELFLKIQEKEVEFGYPDESVFNNCPFVH